ncbi:MAG: hypothetical protein K6D54_05510 [Bacteroidales bacterium]|nr:hypothetical protein [Bacteroidales bacterium]
MVRKVQRRLIPALLLLAGVLNAYAQNDSEQKDSLVRLMKASSLQLTEEMGRNYRKSVDATFLHNNTYLICDTAIWDVDAEIINAYGHVQVIQDETILTSDKMDYYINENLVKFHGPIVQLQNKKENTLRTRHLDYNTRDSIAIFSQGAAMQDKDGQIIESRNGTYDSRTKFFTFLDDVNMFSDSVFIKTERLDFDSETNKAIFPVDIDFWKDDNMLSARRGWYDRESETFFFTDSVHGLSRDQEIWSDSLYFYRTVNEVLMLSNAQVQDTSRKVMGFADYILYQDSLARITMRHRAAVAMQTEQENRLDTLYIGADTLVYETIRRCDIPEAIVTEAQSRLDGFSSDAIESYRIQAEEAAREEARQRAIELGLIDEDEEESGGTPDSGPPDLSLDRGGISQQLGDLSSEKEVPADEPEEGDPEAGEEGETEEPEAEPAPPDSTKVGFIDAIGTVKVYRQDIQALSGRMQYCDLDSIARFTVDPVIWNDGNRQYTAQTILVLVHNGGLEKANLVTDAFITVQEDANCFDQIKSPEIMAYFDTTSALRRFDALGGAQALFFLEENEQLSTVNQVKCKMFTALLEDGELRQVIYFDQPNNDAYPLAQMMDADRRMAGFNWMGEKKPASRYDVSDIATRESERDAYLAHPQATFVETEIYFPGYMGKIYREIERRDSLAKLAPRGDAAAGGGAAGGGAPADSLSVMADSLGHPVPLDSLAVAADSLGVMTDSLSVAVDSLAVAADSLGQPVPSDSLAVAADSIAQPVLSERERKRQEAEARQAQRIAERDARWARLDSLDALKAAAKEQKKLERQRKKTQRKLLLKQKQDEKDRKRLERYIRYYERQKARKEERERAKAQKEMQKLKE